MSDKSKFYKKRRKTKKTVENYNESRKYGDFL